MDLQWQYSVVSIPFLLSIKFLFVEWWQLVLRNRIFQCKILKIRSINSPLRRDFLFSNVFLSKQWRTSSSQWIVVLISPDQFRKIVVKISIPLCTGSMHLLVFVRMISELNSFKRKNCFSTEQIRVRMNIWICSSLTCCRTGRTGGWVCCRKWMSRMR